jgi:hypothetical protein
MVYLNEDGSLDIECIDKTAIEGGESGIVLNEETQKRGYIDIEEARSLLIQSVSEYCKKLGMK